MIHAAAHPDPPGVDEVLTTFTGGIAFDIGGNVGWAARILAPRFEVVVSCEPCDESYHQLVHTPDNVLPLPLAVSDHDGEVTLVEYADHIAQGQLATASTDAELGWGERRGDRTVQCVTLDSLAGEFRAPDFVKIDVEGHEVHVVRGGMATLRAHAPKLYIEVHGEALGAELLGMLFPIYGDRLETILHPHYPDGSKEQRDHYWLVAR